MQSEPLAETFGALADPARLAMIRLLRKKPRKSSDIADALSLTRPTASRHLQHLRKSGLVEEVASEEEGDARVRVYQLRAEPFSAVRSFVDEVEAFWSDQLASFKAHAEKKRRR